ncbi:hypothetical protein FRX31_004310, partial [Thalictrum thalictroides]
LILNHTASINFALGLYKFTRNEITIGSVLKEISVDGEEPKRIGLTVFQDRKTGHWWFQLNDTINVGYLPTTLLPHLAEGDTDVSWGGLAANPPNGFSPPIWIRESLRK